MAETKLLSDDSADIAKREEVVAKIERGLADAAAGRVVSHAEVLKRLDERYPEQPRR
jgi:predicted transcriptional regulator